MGANWGKNFKISIFGESHGPAIGINIDGLPSGFELDLEMIKEEIKRRAPGTSNLVTPRVEKDEFEILSGALDNVTTGTPLMIIIRNQNQNSKDYTELKDKMRPGHADYSGMMRYKGFNDIRGSGHFSGRITAPLVFAGAIAKQILEKEGILIASHVKKIKYTEDRDFAASDITPEKVNELKKMRMPVLNIYTAKTLEDVIKKVKSTGDSVGGVIEVMAVGIKAGVGDPFFDSIESNLASIIFSVPAVKGLEFGAGFRITEMNGHDANDEMYFDENNKMQTYTNNNGGIIGGITNGMPISFKVAIKPTPSIEKKQKTIDINNMENTELEVTGRHDPCIVPRALVVLEAVAAIAILDSLIESKKY